MSQDHELQKAKELLLSGGIIGLPTETVYGLAASIRSENGLKRIFSIKERPFFDPLIVHISDLEQKGQVIREWPLIADVLAKKFWPGPLTMVLPKHPQLNPLITAGLDTVGLRLPNHEVARAIIRLAGVPLAAPSANKFGKTSPTKAEHVQKAFPKENLYILDGGQSEVGLESTVVTFSLVPNEVPVVSILRPGAITALMIEAALQEANLSVRIEKKDSNASPGHTEHHYMPSIPLLVIEQETPQMKRTTWDQICADFELPQNSRGAELRLDPNPRLAARALYIRMRECVENGAAFIYVLKRKEQADGVWEAIWDRLQRAASRVYTG
jgi:L-threonylcarbamoyladenylate synthase